MAMHLDHFRISCRNIYTAAHRLREETALGFYDGGYLSSTIANKIFPLGSGVYLELNCVVDAGAVEDPKNPGAKASLDSTAKGDCFSLIAMRLDTKAEMEAMAQKHDSTVRTGGRTRPDGLPVEWLSTGGTGPSARGRVSWYCHEDRMYRHPSGQPVVAAPGLVTPMGIAWLEVGGTEQKMTDWIGQPASNFPYRFNGKAYGLHAIAVNTSKGEVVIKRRTELDV